MSSAKLGATEQRWAAQLASFDFDVKYRSGQSNRNADALSRQYSPEVQTLEAMVPGQPLPKPLQQALQLDRIKATQSAIRLVEEGGILYRRILRPAGAEPGLQLLLPTVLKEEVLFEVHQGMDTRGLSEPWSCYGSTVTGQVCQLR